MPSHWYVELRPVQEAARKPSPRSLHAAVRTWLDDENTHIRVPAYSIGRPVRRGRSVLVPLSLVDDGLSTRLQERAAPGPLRYRATKGGFVDDPGWRIAGLTLDHHIPLDDLLATPPSHRWHLKHLTAATNQVRGSWYTCDLSVTDLLRRPHAALCAGNAQLPDVSALAAQVLVTDHELSSEVFHPVIGEDAQRLTVSGCWGWRVWRINSPEAAHAVSVLLRLAEFTGVGDLFTYGFGQLQAEPGPTR